MFLIKNRVVGKCEELLKSQVGDKEEDLKQEKQSILQQSHVDLSSSKTTLIVVIFLLLRLTRHIKSSDAQSRRRLQALCISWLQVQCPLKRTKSFAKQLRKIFLRKVSLYDIRTLWLFQIVLFRVLVIIWNKETRVHQFINQPPAPRTLDISSYNSI